MADKLDLEPLDLEPVSEGLDLEPLALEEVPVAPPPSKAESLLGGAQQGVTLGFADELAGLAGAAGYAYESGSLEGLKSNYEQARDEERARQKALEAANPKTYMAGALVGSAPSAIVGGSLPALAGVGAVTGLGSAEGDIWEQAKSTALGGVLGGAAKVGGDVVGSLAGKSLDALKPLYNKIKDKVGLDAAQKWLETQAGKLAEKAAGMERTQGQREVMARLLKTRVDEGEIGKELLKKEAIGRGPAQTAEKLQTLRTNTGEKIGEVVGEMEDLNVQEIRQRLLDRASQIPPQGKDNLDLIRALEREAKAFKPKVLKEATPEQFSSVVDEFGNPIKIGEATEEVLSGAIPASEIQSQKIAAGQKGYNLTDVENRTKAIVNAELDAALKAKMTPEQLTEYADLNRTFGLIAPAETAAAKGAAAELGKKVISVGTIPAVGLVGGYAGGGSEGALKGLAAASAFRAAGRYAPSIAAKSTWSAAKLIEKAPDRLKGVLQAALDRGEKSFASTHYLLQQRDPEYNKVTTEDEE
jgi:hypothetical protein